MSNKNWRIIWGLATAMWLSGCLFLPPETPQVFEVPNPLPPTDFGCPVIIEGVRNATSTLREMKFVLDRDEVKYDGKQNWAQPPDLMLSRILNGHYRSVKNDSNVQEIAILVTILAFHVDVIGQNAKLGVKYTVRLRYPGARAVYRELVGVQTFVAKMDNLTAAASTGAMADCVRQFLEKMDEDIFNFSQTK